MSRRTVSLLMGGGVALVALFAILTTAPVVTGEQQSATKQLHSEAAESDTSTCATIDFEATFHYTVTRPVLDLWGFRTVDDVTIDPADMTVTGTPDSCAGQGLADIGGASYVATTPCPDDIGALVATEVTGTTAQSECDGRLVFFSVVDDGDAQSVPMTFNGPQAVASSGYGRGGWCLTYSSDARYSSSGGATVAGATTTSGDLCLDVS